MGEDGCAWVLWGAGGISNTKSRQAGDIYGVSDQDLTPMVMAWCHMIWPGKFPRTSCFGVFDKKWCGWVQMDKKRFAWVRMDQEARRIGKTRGKDPQMGI